MEGQNQNIETRSRAGKILGGFFIVGVGVVYLLDKMGYMFPAWLFTWPCLLIAIGMFIILRSGFRNVGGVIIMIVGGVFLFQQLNPHTPITPYLWPAAVIIVGLFMIFTPHHSRWSHSHHRKWRKQYSKEDWRKYKEDWKQYRNEWKYGTLDPKTMTSGDDYIDIISVFGATHRVIVSKNFKGGDMINVFGGTELNLSQADINGTVYIDATQIFGGGKIIIPSNWEFRSEVANVFVGIEDKRSREKTMANPDKVLVITGATIFGGLEIVSY